MYEIDFGEMCIGTKGVGEGGQRGLHLPLHFHKRCGLGWTNPLVPPLTFRHRATVLGYDIDSQTKSAFSPIQMLSFTVYRTLYGQTKP